MSKNFLNLAPDVIEGIGNERKKELSAAGVNTIADMLNKPPRYIKRILKSTSLQQISNWFNAALFMQIDDVTPDISEAFVSGGVESIEELADAGLQTLERIIKREYENGKISEIPSLYRLAGMQRNASRLIDTGMLVGKIIDANTKKPLTAAKINIGRKSYETVEDGLFFFSGLPAGKNKLSVEIKDRELFSAKVNIIANKLTDPITFRINVKNLERQPRIIRESEGNLIWMKKSTTAKFINRKLTELPDDTYLQIRKISSSGSVRLMHLSRVWIDNKIFTEIVNIDLNLLPEGVDVGSVLHFKNGLLKMSEITPKQFARRKLERILGKITIKKRKKIINTS